MEISAAGQESYKYNALGDVKTVTQRNYNSTSQSYQSHDYSYDVVGRFIADKATVIGDGVNGSVRRLETAYDAAGLPYLFTSWDATSGGNIVNQVQKEFNGLGQLVKEFQSHAGAANTGTTPKVQYEYSDMSGGNHSRLTKIKYPNKRNGDIAYCFSNNPVSALSEELRHRDSGTSSIVFMLREGVDLKEEPAMSPNPRIDQRSSDDLFEYPRCCRNRAEVFPMSNDLIDIANMEKQLLREADDGEVGLWAIVWLVRYALNGGEFPESEHDRSNPFDVRRLTMQLVRNLLESGNVTAGNYRFDGSGQIEPWTSGLDVTLARIDAEWSALGREPRAPGEVVLFYKPA